MPLKPPSHIAAIQTSATNVTGSNLVSIRMLIENAVRQGAKLVVLPSQFSYVPEKDAELANAREIIQSGRVQQFLCKLAAEYKVWIVGGTLPIAIESTKKVALSTLVWSDHGEQVARYDKIHLCQADLGGISPLHEADYIEPGRDAVVINTPLGKLGLAIDFDLYFPQHFQMLKAKGAEIIAIPSLFYSALGQYHWRTLLKARAIETQSYVVAANQFGELPNGHLLYGHSSIIEPWGRTLSYKETAAGVVSAEIDLARLAFLRQDIPL